MDLDIRLQQSYGEFLCEFLWDWYCVLTFRNNMSPRLAFKTFNRWKVQLKKAANQPIDYALFIERKGLKDYWKGLFHSLSDDEKACLINVLSEYKTNKPITTNNHPRRVRKILVLYTINKSQFDRGEKSSRSVISEIESL